MDKKYVYWVSVDDDSNMAFVAVSVSPTTGAWKDRLWKVEEVTPVVDEMDLASSIGNTIRKGDLVGSPPDSWHEDDYLTDNLSAAVRFFHMQVTERAKWLKGKIERLGGGRARVDSWVSKFGRNLG